MKCSHAAAIVLVAFLLCAQARAQRVWEVNALFDLAMSPAAAVNAGQTVQWTIRSRVFESGTLGISGVSTSLRQTSGPAPVFLVPAAAVGPEMTPFRRPAGLCGPGRNGAPDGFGGDAVPNPFGGTDVISIGGAQNNFGVALPPIASFATQAQVVAGVGASDWATVAVGTFTVPIRVGVYRFELDSSSVNVFAQVAAPPARSTVLAARTLSTSSVELIVICRADYNNSGSLTIQDLFDFLDAYFAGLPSADFNGIGGVTIQDVFDFLDAWFAGCEF